MTPEPIPEKDEEEIDPVEAVRRAVGAVERTEFEDGHELKQLIKNENGVTLPDAGKFLLKALRADDPPLRRDGDTFVQTDTGKLDETKQAESEEGADGAETEAEREGTEDPRFGTVPDELRGRDVWAVRYSDGTVVEGLTLGEAIDETDTGNADAEVGYGDVVTIRVAGLGDGEGDFPEPPFEDVYAEDLPEREGWRVPVFEYDEPPWWSDTEGDVTVRVSTGGFREFGEPAESAQGASVATGGRALDEWLADVRRDAGEAVFDEVPDDVPEMDETRLTDSQVEEALEYLDPDLPYPDWRRVGAALADNYAGTEGGVEKARRTFEDWSREGSVYAEGDAEFVRDIENTGANVGVGYLVHKACLEGWVWEADEDRKDEVPVGGEVGSGTEDLDGRSDRGGNAEVVASTEEATGTGVNDVRVVVEDDEAASKPEDAEFVEHDNGYGYETADGFERVTNFTLETRRRIDCEECRLLRLVVHPEKEDPYGVTVGTDVLNSVDRFRDEVVTGFSTWFDGGESALNEIRERVGAEGQRVEGTGSVGLHLGTDEFVTPSSTLVPGKETEPDTVFTERLGGEGVPDRWTVTKGDTTEEEVVEVLEHLPGIHVTGEFLTVLGWFYAAPLKPFVVDRSEYFPNLWLTGDVDAAKPKLRLIGRAFGTDGEPFLPQESSPFDVLRSTRSVPVWYDGYAWDRKFEQLCLKTTQCVKARSNGNVEEVTAPVVVTGDEPRDGSLDRRSIGVEFVGANGNVSESYAELVGRSYYEDGELCHPDGANLGAHAEAYYSWIAGMDMSTLDGVWEDCLRSAADVLESRDSDGLADIHEVRVTLFGLRLYQRFADEKGAEPSINRNRRTGGIATSSEAE